MAPPKYVLSPELMEGDPRPFRVVTSGNLYLTCPKCLNSRKLGYSIEHRTVKCFECGLKRSNVDPAVFGPAFLRILAEWEVSTEYSEAHLFDFIIPDRNCDACGRYQMGYWTDQMLACRRCHKISDE